MKVRLGGAGLLGEGACMLQALSLASASLNGPAWFTPTADSWLRESGDVAIGSFRLTSTEHKRGFALSTIDFKVLGKIHNRSRQYHVTTPWTNQNGRKNQFC